MVLRGARSQMACTTKAWRVSRCHATISQPTWAQKCEFERARQELRGDASFGATAHSRDESGPWKQTVEILSRLPQALSLAPGESPSCLWSARVRWKGRNKTFTTACTLLQQLAFALSPHHGCIILAFRAVDACILPCSVSVSGRILARKGSLDASP